MNYVATDDIIVSIDSFLDIKKGTSQTYNLLFFRDYLNNQLNVSNVSLISIAVVNSSGNTLAVYSNQVMPGTTGSITIGSTANGNQGSVSFVISSDSSMNLGVGDLNIVVTLVYYDFYPSSKTYRFPALKIGMATTGDIIIIDPEDPPINPPTIKFSGEYIIQYTNGSVPTLNGNLSTNSNILENITKFTYKILDINLVRITMLENFLINRIDGEGVSGTITIFDKNSKLYSIYKILGWSRIDINTGNGNSEDLDGIILNVLFESASTGPGISKNTWNVGDHILYSLDSYGNSSVGPDPTGILTYVDKNIQCQFQTNGNNSPTGVRITYTPFSDSYITVEVNGISVDVGDGIKTKSVYFSNDSGATAIRIANIRNGDQLIWNGDIAGFELEVGDDINLIYEALSDDVS